MLKSIRPVLWGREGFQLLAFSLPGASKFAMFCNSKSSSFDGDDDDDDGEEE